MFTVGPNSIQFQFRFQLWNGTIRESIPIPELESCITDSVDIFNNSALLQLFYK